METSSRGESKPLTPKTGRRERHKAEVRERLFRAAIDLYKTKGLQATTVQEITEAADVGKGTFFNYFPTKEHVLVEFYARQNGRAQEALRSVRTGEPFKEAVTSLRHRFAGDASSPALTRSFLLALVSNQAVFDMALQHILSTREVSTEMLRLGQLRGEVRRDRPANELARVVQQLSFGTAMFWLCNPGESLEQLLDANFRLVCAASTPATSAAANRSSGGPAGQADSSPVRQRSVPRLERPRPQTTGRRG